jgi:hypothetical protein
MEFRSNAFAAGQVRFHTTLIALSEVIGPVGRTYLPGWIDKLARMAAGASLTAAAQWRPLGSQRNRGFASKLFLVTRIDLRAGQPAEELI